MSTEKDPFLIPYLVNEMGYSHVRRLKSGEVAGIMRMNFTTGLFVGLNYISYRTRFCYHGEEEAAQAIEEWDGHGDPPGPWIKEKGGKERLGPGARRFEPIPPAAVDLIKENFKLAALNLSILEFLKRQEDLIEKFRAMGYDRRRFFEEAQKLGLIKLGNRHEL